LPKKWRRLLLFRYALGLNGNQLAKALKRPAEEIERGLAAARKALRRNLKIVMNRPARPRPVVQAAGGSLLRRPGSA
jgi:DNA-directed RNA polymerase specialized sigma24 family protein